jgi:iron(III) transport system substrate-binding protein
MQLLGRSRLTALTGLVLSLALVAGACGGDDDTTATTAPDGGGAAGENGSLVVYTGRDEELVQPLIDAFEEESGVSVEVRYGNSAELGAALLEEGDATPADVFYSQEVGAIGALAKADLLAELPEEVVDQVDERFQPGSDNLWVGVTGRTRVIAFNPEVVDEAPTGTAELVEPEYSGQVAIAPGNAGFQAFVTAFRVSEGEDAARDWLEALVANDVEIYESNSDILDAVDAGDVGVGLINHYYYARQLDEREFTAELVFPEGDDPGGLVNATAVGILAGAADNPSALELVEYLVSEAGQEYFVGETYEYPVVDGVDDPEGVPALDELEGPALDLTDLDSLEETQAMLTEVGLLS